MHTCYAYDYCLVIRTLCIHVWVKVIKSSCVVSPSNLVKGQPLIILLVKTHYKKSSRFKVWPAMLRAGNKINNPSIIKDKNWNTGIIQYYALVSWLIGPQIHLLNLNIRIKFILYIMQIVFVIKAINWSQKSISCGFSIK